MKRSDRDDCDVNEGGASRFNLYNIFNVPLNSLYSYAMSNVCTRNSNSVQTEAKHSAESRHLYSLCHDLMFKIFAMLHVCDMLHVGATCKHFSKVLQTYTDMRCKESENALFNHMLEYLTHCHLKEGLMKFLAKYEALLVSKVMHNNRMDYPIGSKDKKRKCPYSEIQRFDIYIRFNDAMFFESKKLEDCFWTNVDYKLLTSEDEPRHYANEIEEYESWANDEDLFYLRYSDEIELLKDIANIFGNKYSNTENSYEVYSDVDGTLADRRHVGPYRNFIYSFYSKEKFRIQYVYSYKKHNDCECNHEHYIYLTFIILNRPSLEASYVKHAKSSFYMVYMTSEQVKLAYNYWKYVNNVGTYKRITYELYDFDCSYNGLL